MPSYFFISFTEKHNFHSGPILADMLFVKLLYPTYVFIYSGWLKQECSAFDFGRERNKMLWNLEEELKALEVNIFLKSSKQRKRLQFDRIFVTLL